MGLAMHHVKAIALKKPVRRESCQNLFVLGCLFYVIDWIWVGNIAGRISVPLSELGFLTSVSPPAVAIATRLKNTTHIQAVPRQPVFSSHAMPPPLKCRRLNTDDADFAEGEQEPASDGSLSHALLMANMALAFGVPRCAAQLVGMLYLLGQVCSTRPLDAVEYFAGKQAVTNGFRSFGFVSVGYEVLDDPLCMDLLTDVGYIFALSLACQVRAGGFALLAPVCSTWVWICRHSVKRSYFKPLGDSQMRCVREANIMVARCVILVLLLSARGVMVVLEQPVSSLMQCPTTQDIRISSHCECAHFVLQSKYQVAPACNFQRGAFRK